MSPSTGEGGSGRQNQDFVEAVAAVCALMASADESAQDCERSSIAAAMSTDPVLSGLDADASAPGSATSSPRSKPKARAPGRN